MSDERTLEEQCYGECWAAKERIAELEGENANFLNLQEEITRLRADLAQRTADLETERLRLAACGVAALSNTPDSAAESRRIQPQYRSASFDDVARAVDREMALRAELEQRTAERNALAAEVEDLKDRIATALLDKAAVERGVMRFRAEVARLTAERDEARREICDRVSTTRWEPQFPLMSKREYAEERGWDCFKEVKP